MIQYSLTTILILKTKRDSMQTKKGEEAKIASKPKEDLYDLLGTLTDFRRAEGKRHELRFVLFIMIMSTMSGFIGIRPTSDFTKKNSEELIRLFKPKKNRLPSVQTFERIVQHVDSEDLNRIFTQWALNHVAITNHDWLSIDGKVISGTITDSTNRYRSFIGSMSIFANKTKQVLMAKEINCKKETEIPTLKTMIKMLGLKDVVFTADALHCQTETTKAIIESGNDYCLGVKGNQRKLYTQVKKKYS